MQDYIVDYEGKKEDDIDDVAHFFKKLLIDTSQDVSSNTDTTNKLFLTQLGPLQNTKLTNTINLLSDNVFKHQITSANITVLVVNLMSYSFTTLTNIQYNNSKFKELLIDLRAATWSIGGLGQLKAL